MKVEEVKIDEFITPLKMIYKNRLYKITKLDPKYHINGYRVLAINDKIEGVTIDSPHPNADPTNGDFCVPDALIGKNLNEQSINSINSMLCCFNIDSCYFTPWGEITYEKI